MLPSQSMSRPEKVDVGSSRSRSFGSSSTPGRSRSFAGAAGRGRALQARGSMKPRDAGFSRDAATETISSAATLTAGSPVRSPVRRIKCRKEFCVTWSGPRTWSHLLKGESASPSPCATHRDWTERRASPLTTGISPRRSGLNEAAEKLSPSSTCRRRFRRAAREPNTGGDLEGSAAQSATVAP